MPGRPIRQLGMQVKLEPQLQVGQKNQLWISGLGGPTVTATGIVKAGNEDTWQFAVCSIILSEHMTPSQVWFEEKGFGFVSPAEGGDDCYVHRTAENLQFSEKQRWEPKLHKAEG